MTNVEESKVRILVVEDEAVVGLALQVQLERLGYDVIECCSTGADALERARRDKPDLLLLDIRLKGSMDGIDVAHAIGRDAPIIFLTAHADDETLTRAKEVAPLAYLIKPYAFLTLKVTLEVALASLRIRAERRAAEVARQQAEDHAKAIIDTSTDAILSIDQDQRIQLFNRGAEKVFGYSAAEVLGQPLERLLEPKTRMQHRHWVHDFQTDSASSSRTMNQQRRVMGLRSDGTPVPLQISISKQGIRGGQRSTAIARDVSALERMRQELEMRRSLGLATRLASSVAHDMNNVLTVVFNIAYSIQEVESIQEAAHLGEQLMEAGRRARSLARRLAPARSAPRDPTVDMAGPLELGAATSDMLNLLRQIVGPRIQLRASLQPDCLVDIELLAFEQILLNLHVNARDAMPHGGRVELRLEASGDQVHLLVADDGPGMPDEVAARCFDPFYTTRPEDGGTGLGLATVAENVRAVGGRVEVQSAQGQGTRFKIELPRSQRAPAARVRCPRPRTYTS